MDCHRGASPDLVQAICEFMFQNGVRGVLYAGDDNNTGCSVRPIGTEGRIDLREGEKPLQATEVIFATYESSRRRGRVDLPLKQKDSAYLGMIENGELKPKRK